MASPFEIFRRHQRVLLACVGVLAMIAFVFVSPFAQYGGGGRTLSDPVVVETKDLGDLRESDLQSLRWNHRLAFIFLRDLVALVSQREAEQQQSDQRMRQFFAQMMLNTRLNQISQVLDRSKPLGDAAALETFVLAKQAEAAGIVVSDKTINDYIASLIGTSIDRNELRQLIASLGGRGNTVSERGLFQALRMEMLASEYSRTFSIDLEPVPPGQRFDYFTRLNERATIEALAIPVSNFISQVAEPTTAQLKELFAAHKDHLPDPASPDPGFKEPKKIALQYFVANRDDFIRRAEEKVTDAQIAEYYEKNKETQFRKAPPSDETKPAPPGAGDGATPGESATPGNSAAKPAADERPADAKPRDAKPADEPKPGADSAPDAQKPAAPPANEPPAAPKSGGKSAGESRRATFRLVADEKPAPAAGNKPAADAAAPLAAPSSAPAAEKPAGEAPPTDKPAEKPVAAPAAPQFEPLDQVKDDIRRHLAQIEANQQITVALGELYSLMQRYSEDRVIELSEAPDEIDEPVKSVSESSKRKKAKVDHGLKPLDFAALAKQYGFEARETPLVSARQLFDDSEIGRSTPKDSTSFIRQAFGDDSSLFTPRQSSDLHREFLFWVTQAEPEKIPTFDQAKPRVERDWKIIAARTLAQKKAEACMAEAQTDKKTLEALFGKQSDMRVLKPAPFSWATLGVVARDSRENEMPRLSEVEGVEMPGEGFMRSVFKLSPGDFGVASNQPQLTFYVVHLLFCNPTRDSLYAQFGAEDDRKYMMLADIDRSRMFQNWVDGVFEDVGVRWKRTPNVERFDRGM